MSQKIIPHKYKLKRAKAEVAQKLNPLLLEGEPIVITEQTKKGPVMKLKIGDGKTLYNELSFLGGEGSGLVEIIEPCHIATLDVGTYMIRGTNSGANGKVILKNVTDDKTVDEELLTITDGLLLITSNVKNIVSEDPIGDVEECLVTFTAQGLISDPSNLYLKNNKHSITVNNLRIIKSPVSENDFIEGNWYTYDNIIIEEPIYQYVDELRNYVNDLYNLDKEDCEATGYKAHVHGIRNKATGVASNAQGVDNIASGDHSTVEGYGNEASGDNSHAQGSGTKSSGAASHSEGLNTEAAGDASHSEGAETKALGYVSHSEGLKSKAKGEVSHAEGCETVAEGEHSHSEGNNTLTTGVAAHAEGVNTQAIGPHSHAEGFGTIAQGAQSHSEGGNTAATGYGSHTQGINTQANGVTSDASGFETIANGNQQHVGGRYNIVDNNNEYAEIIGNGDALERSNARTLDWNGNGWYNGDIVARKFFVEDENLVTTSIIDVTEDRHLYSSYGIQCGITHNLPPNRKYNFELVGPTNISKRNVMCLYNNELEVHYIGNLWFFNNDYADTGEDYLIYRQLTPTTFEKGDIYVYVRNEGWYTKVKLDLIESCTKGDRHEIDVKSIKELEDTVNKFSESIKTKNLSATSIDMGIWDNATITPIQSVKTYYGEYTANMYPDILIPNQYYLVEFDGVEYRCKCTYYGEPYGWVLVHKDANFGIYSPDGSATIFNAGDEAGGHTATLSRVDLNKSTDLLFYLDEFAAQQQELNDTINKKVLLNKYPSIKYRTVDDKQVAYIDYNDLTFNSTDTVVLSSGRATIVNDISSDCLYELLQDDKTQVIETFTAVKYPGESYQKDAKNDLYVKAYLTSDLYYQVNNNFNYLIIEWPELTTYFNINSVDHMGDSIYKLTISYIENSPIQEWTYDVNDLSITTDQTIYHPECKLFFGKVLGENSNSFNTSTAYGKNSNAFGDSTIAKGENQTTLGRFNEIDEENRYAVIVGNGTDNENRSNAFTVDWHGNTRVAGELEAQGMSTEYVCTDYLESTVVCVGDWTEGNANITTVIPETEFTANTSNTFDANILKEGYHILTINGVKYKCVCHKDLIGADTYQYILDRICPLQNDIYEVELYQEAGGKPGSIHISTPSGSTDETVTVSLDRVELGVTELTTYIDNLTLISNEIRTEIFNVTNNDSDMLLGDNLIELGTEYIIVFDGVEYKLTCIQGDNEVYIGDDTGLISDTSTYPFKINQYDNGSTNLYTTNAEHTCILYKLGTEKVNVTDYVSILNEKHNSEVKALNETITQLSDLVTQLSDKINKLEENQNTVIADYNLASELLGGSEE